MSEESYEQIVIRDKAGNSTTTLQRPIFGDLVMKTVGGRIVIEQTGLWGGKTIYVPGNEDAIEAKN